MRVANHNDQPRAQYQEFLILPASASWSISKSLMLELRRQVHSGQSRALAVPIHESVVVHGHNSLLGWVLQASASALGVPLTSAVDCLFLDESIFTPQPLR